jgi:predicted PurR-regulated permease PerM
MIRPYGDVETQVEDDRSAQMLQVRVHPLVRLFVWAALLTVTVVYLDTISFVVLVLLAAGCMASLLQPLRNRLPWPKWLSGSVVGVFFALMFAGLFVLLGWLLSRPILAEASQWPQIVESMNAKLAEWTGAAGLSDSITVQAAGEQIFNWLTGAGGELFKQVMNGAGVALVGFAFFAFGFIYLLSEKNGDIIRAVQRLLPRHEGTVPRFFGDLSFRLRWWALGIMLSMTITGLLTALGYWVIGLPSWTTLAMLAAIAEIVPTLGPALVFGLALILASTAGEAQVVGVAITWLVVQTVESYVILPLVMRQAVNIPPIVTLASIVLWGRLLGPLGLILALPLDLAIWTAVEQFHFQAEPSDSERKLQPHGLSSHRPP